MKKLLVLISLFIATQAYAGMSTDSLTVGNVSNTEIQYLDGVTSGIQSQLNGKQAADSDLTTYAGITPSANVQSLLGAADYSAMRTQLSLVPGTNVQAYDADLTTYAGITPSANVQSLLGAANYSAMRTQLSLVPGTDVQTQDADLNTLSSPTAWRLFYSNGSSVITELALGADGTYLKSNGASSAPTFSAVTAAQTPWTSDINGSAYNLTTTGTVTAGSYSTGGNTSGTLKLLETGTTPTYYTTLQSGDLSANRTITLPATAGTLALNTPVSTSAAGLCPQLSNNASTYLDGTGNYTAPPGGGASPAGSGTEIQYRANATALGAVTNSSYAAGVLTVPHLEVAAELYKDEDSSHYYNLTGKNSNLTYNVTINMPVANGTLMVGDNAAYNATTWDGATDAPSKDAIRDKIEALPGGHNAVTLAADADVLLGLSTQELNFDTQTANLIFAGPSSGAAADPTFRALVDDDIPANITLGANAVVQSGASVTTDAAGEIGVRTGANMTGGIQVYGAASTFYPAQFQKSCTITNITNASQVSVPLWYFPINATVRAIHATSSTGNANVTLQKFVSNATTGVAIDSSYIATNTSFLSDDGTLSNATIPSSSYVGLLINNATANATLTVGWEGTYD